MITQDKIRIYKKYNGESDSWARSGSKNEKSYMADSDWYLIDGLLQDVFLVKEGLTSLEFRKDLDKRLKENCDSEDTIFALKSIIIR